MKKIILAPIIFMSLFSISLKIAAAARPDAIKQEMAKNKNDLARQMQELVDRNELLEATICSLETDSELLKAITNSLETDNVRLKKLLLAHGIQDAIDAIDARPKATLDALAQKIMAPLQTILNTPAITKLGVLGSTKSQLALTEILSKALEDGAAQHLPTEYIDQIKKLGKLAQKKITDDRRLPEEEAMIVNTILAPLRVKNGNEWVINPEFLQRDDSGKKISRSKTSMALDITAILARSVAADLKKSDLEIIDDWTDKARELLGKP